MNKSRFLQNLATFGPWGYFLGSGTIGSIFALPFIYVLHNYFSLTSQLIIIFLLTIFSLWVIAKACTYFRMRDPGQIIIDEFVGCTIAFYGLELNYVKIFMVFILFRFFDITKLFGLRYIEKFLNRPLAILVDDIVAALFANIIVRTIF